MELRSRIRTMDALGATERSAELLVALKSYALLPYLQYDQLLLNIANADRSTIALFLNESQVPVLNTKLRQAWLGEQRRRANWREIVDMFAESEPTDDASRCHYMTALMRLGRSLEWQSRFLTLWQTGKRPPVECNDLNTEFLADPSTSRAMIWQTARSAMLQNSATYGLELARSLDAAERRQLELWAFALRNPRTALDLDELKVNTPIVRDIVMQAFQRLAHADAYAAVGAWPAIRNRYTFTPSQLQQAEKAMALAASAQKHPDAEHLLAALPASAVDGNVQNARLQTAIAARNWNLLLEWTADSAKQGMDASRWTYWRARALGLTGRNHESSVLFAVNATQLDYYGRLSAERSPSPYATPAPPPVSAARIQTLALLPSAIRARELYFTGFNTEAREEWSSLIANLDRSDLIAAAHLASTWNWTDRVIATLGRAGGNQALALRFPRPFQELVKAHAAKRHLPEPLVYGVMRTESIFMEDARSRTGALGLMQLMPATAREVARRLRVSLDSPEQLLFANTNIPLGTAYLEHVRDHFHGNVILSVAAYNAGPSRVDTWMPRAGCAPAEYWIESIPFTETRGYVRSVLFAASVYGRDDQKSDNQLLTMLSQAIPPRTAAGINSERCTLDVVKS